MLDAGFVAVDVDALVFSLIGPIDMLTENAIEMPSFKFPLLAVSLGGMIAVPASFLNGELLIARLMR